jgi:hypothetical protein
MSSDLSAQEVAERAVNLITELQVKIGDDLGIPYLLMKEAGYEGKDWSTIFDTFQDDINEKFKSMTAETKFNSLKNMMYFNALSLIFNDNECFHIDHVNIKNFIK